MIRSRPVVTTRALRRVVFGLLVSLALTSDEAEAVRTRAAGGVRLIEAMEEAPASVVAEVAETRALGGTGHGGTLVVESALTSDTDAGSRLEIAWEELSPSRAPRFRAGDRVLVALEPLPGASIWLARIPDAKRRTRTLTVAMKGNAFLRSPGAASMLVLEHYLALPPDLRAGGTGAVYLAQLAARAEIPLALDAVARLETRQGLADEAVGTVGGDLVSALLRSDAPRTLGDALVDLIGSRELSGLRDPLTALANGDPLAPPIVYAALAALDGELSDALTLRLLAEGAGPYRDVVARHAGGAAAKPELRSLISGDPSPEVRTQAIERLVELDGADAVPFVADALYDRAPSVRGVAARELAMLGDPAIPELQRVVDSNDLDAARAAIAGLALIGTSESSAALVEIREHHSEESIRNVARLATGARTGHDHD